MEKSGKWISTSAWLEEWRRLPKSGVSERRTLGESSGTEARAHIPSWCTEIRRSCHASVSERQPILYLILKDFLINTYALMSN